MAKEKKKKEKEQKESLFKKIKEAWKVPRYKAFIKLGLYLLFFLSLYVIYEVSILINPPKIDNTNKEEKIDYVFESYTYNFKINKYLKDEIKTITYSGTSLSNIDNGIVKYDNIKTSTYTIDKTNNKIYIDGVEKKQLYDIVDSNYFSYKYLDNLIKLSDGNKYIDENNNIIEIISNNTSKKKTYKVDFNKKYTSDEYDKITLELEFYSID